MQRWWHGLLALNPQEREQVGIDEVRVSSAQTMRRSGNELQLRTLNQFSSENRCVIIVLTSSNILLGLCLISQGGQLPPFSMKSLS